MSLPRSHAGVRRTDRTLRMPNDSEAVAWEAHRAADGGRRERIGRDNVRAKGVITEEYVWNIVYLLIPVCAVKRDGKRFVLDPAQEAAHVHGIRFRVGLELHHSPPGFVGDILAERNLGKRFWRHHMHLVEAAIPAREDALVREGVALAVGPDIIHGRIMLRGRIAVVGK